MRSIRGRLLAGTAAVAVLVLLASGLAVYGGVRSHLIEQFDRGLLEQARLLAGTVEQEFGVLDIGFEDLDLTEFEQEDDPSYLQLRLGNGFSLYRSESLEESELPWIEGREEPQFGNARALDVATRAIVLRFIPRVEIPDPVAEDDPPVITGPNIGACVLMLARPLEPVHELLATLRGLLIIAGVAGVASLLILLHFVIAGGLRPVHRIAGEIAALDPADLSRRVEPGDSPAEIRPIVERLNELLDRLEHAFVRERGLSADIAHELRTPVAGLRTTIEVSLAKERGGGEYREALNQSLSIVRGLESMIERLLWLFRLETDQVESRTEPVDLAKAVADCWVALQDRTEQRELRVETDLGAAIAHADPELVRLAIRNVLENAFLHTPAGGSIRITTGTRSARAELHVSNTAHAIPPESVARLFDRFVRGDEARTGDGLHVGLGLALVKEAAEAAGALVEAASEGGEFRIRIAFPAQ